jgi:WD40 repeat protein
MRVDAYSAAVRGGHVAAAWGVAASADGRWVATASHDRTVKLWDARTWRLVHTLGGHPDIAWCVAFSPDSRWLVSGSGTPHSGVTFLWDVETGRQLLRLDGHKRLVVSLAFHPSLPFLVSSSLDGSVHLWDTRRFDQDGQAGPCEPTLVHQFDQAVHKVCFRRDGAWLAAACQDHRVALWDFAGVDAPVAALPEPQVLRQHTCGVWAVAFSHDGRYLASGDERGSIVLWDGDSFHYVATLASPTSRIRALAFSHDCGLLAAGTFGRAAVVWDLDQVRRTLDEVGLNW